MKKEHKHSICNGYSTLIFSCSGAADVGALADMAAREMTKKCFVVLAH